MSEAFTAALPAVAGSMASGMGSGAAGSAISGGLGSAASSGLGKAALSSAGSAVAKQALSVGESFGKALAQAPAQAAQAPMATNPISASSPMAENAFSGGAPLTSMGSNFHPSPPVYQPDPTSGAPTMTGAVPRMPVASAPIAGPAPAGGAQQPSFGDMLKTMAMTRMASGSAMGGQDAAAAMQAAAMGRPYAPSLQGGQSLTPDQIKQLLQRFGGKF